MICCWTARGPFTMMTAPLLLSDEETAKIRAQSFKDEDYKNVNSLWSSCL